MMTITFDGTKYNVLLGSLLYSVHDNRRDAELSMGEYFRMRRVGRA